MVTLVGTQKKLQDALASLVELDFAAVASYEEALEHLKNQEYRKVLEEFTEDHRRHIKELSEILRESGETPPTSAGMKQLFTKGKVLFANLVGDKAILMALHSNEEDTNVAYERMNAHPERTKQASEVLSKGLRDERKHREWLQKTIDES